MIDHERVRFCARVFKAFGEELKILADHRIIYQVGESWQCKSIEELELRAEQMLKYRRKRHDIR